MLKLKSFFPLYICTEVKTLRSSRVTLHSQFHGPNTHTGNNTIVINVEFQLRSFFLEKQTFSTYRCFKIRYSNSNIDGVVRGVGSWRLYTRVVLSLTCLVTYVIHCIIHLMCYGIPFNHLKIRGNKIKEYWNKCTGMFWSKTMIDASCPVQLFRYMM